MSIPHGRKRTLVIASGNAGKVREFRELLQQLPLELQPQPEGMEVEETGLTFAENARLKARFEPGIFSKGESGFLHLHALWLGLQLQWQLLQELPKLTHLAGIAAGNHQSPLAAMRNAHAASANSRAQANTSATRPALGASQ